MADDWDDERVERWLKQSGALDRQMAPITEALFAAAELQRGERVLDVGCGHGPTTRRAAGEVGAEGHVTGVDIAAGMLQAARSLEVDDGAAPIDWLEADVASWDPEIVPVDAVISRFGVMFFDDPIAAFANLRRATRSAGRLAVATWAVRDRSEMFQLPLSVALPLLSELGIPAEEPPLDAGAFSLGTPAALERVLTGAGWDDAEPVEHQVRLHVGGGLGPLEAARSAVDLGPTRVVTSGLDQSIRDRVVVAMAEAFRDCVDDDGDVVLRGTFLVTTARNPS